MSYQREEGWTKNGIGRVSGDSGLHRLPKDKTGKEGFKFTSRKGLGGTHRVQGTKERPGNYPYEGATPKKGDLDREPTEPLARPTGDPS